jgi:hypothetical protein
VDFILYPLALLLVIILIFIAVAVKISISKPRKVKTSYYRAGRQVYIPGEFSMQMELDLRLPYRRFRQLYPHSKLTYKEYKRLQMQRAFRRSMSSQDNKRMVR